MANPISLVGIFRLALLLSCLGLTLVCLRTGSAHGTTIIAVMTVNELYVGADSKVRGIGSGGLVLEARECKIKQVGKFFYAHAGFMRDTHGWFDMERLVTDAVRKEKSISGMVNILDKRIAQTFLEALNKLKERNVSYDSDSLAMQNIRFALFGFENQSPVLRIRHFAQNVLPDGSVEVISKNPIDCDFNCLEKRTQIHTYFVARTADAPFDFLRTNPKSPIMTRPPALITKLIEIDIASNPDKSGGPIHILQMTKSGPTWIEKAECPEIRATNG